jgi:hypothetical protein
VESAVNTFEELEQSLTRDQAEPLVDCDSVPDVERPNSTQQLLDEMLGLFEDDDSSMLLTHGLGLGLRADSDE